MGELVQLEDPSNYAVVAKRIKHLWFTGNYQLLPHIEKRMEEREIDMLDVEHVIRYGQIVDHSRPDETWRYVMSGKCVEGRALKFILEVSDLHMSLISIMVRGNIR